MSERPEMPIVEKSSIMNEEKLIGISAFVIYNNRLRISTISRVEISVTKGNRDVRYQFLHIPGSYSSKDVFFSSDSLIKSAKDHTKEEE